MAAMFASTQDWSIHKAPVEAINGAVLVANGTMTVFAIVAVRQIKEAGIKANTLMLYSIFQCICLGELTAKAVRVFDFFEAVHSD